MYDDEHRNAAENLGVAVHEVEEGIVPVVDADADVCRTADDGGGEHAQGPLQGGRVRDPDHEEGGPLVRPRGRTKVLRVVQRVLRLEQLERGLGALVGLGEHRGTCLHQDLVLGEVGGLLGNVDKLL